MRALLFCLALGAVALTGAMDARAQEDDRRPRLGVVDLQKIMQESVAAQKVRAEVEARQNTYRQDISGRENELRTQQQELERQRTILSAEAFAERQKEFSHRVEALQREVVERNKQLEGAMSYGMQQVQRKALQIIAELSDKKKLGLVLDKSQLLLVTKGLEFSDEVLVELNKQLTEVSTTPPAPDKN